MAATEALSSAMFELNAAAPEFVPRRGSRKSAGSDTTSGRGPSRRSTSSLEAPGQVATLVVKNLGLDLKQENLVRFLEERGLPAMAVELHLDAAGAFRGTAFIRYSTPTEACAALEKLGTSADFGGRKVRIEIQKSKSLLGRRSLEAELAEEDLTTVRAEIERFMQDDSMSEMRLSASLSVQQRKYAHSLAERHCLNHVTSQGDNGEKHVLLSKARRMGQETTGAARPRAQTAVTSSTGRIAGTAGSQGEVSGGGGRRRKSRAQSAAASLWSPSAEMLWSPQSAPTPVVGFSPGLGPWMPPPAWGLQGFLLPPPGLGWDGDCNWPDPASISLDQNGHLKEQNTSLKTPGDQEGSTEATDGVTEDEQTSPDACGPPPAKGAADASLQDAPLRVPTSPARRTRLSTLFRHVPCIGGGQC